MQQQNTFYIVLFSLLALFTIVLHFCFIIPATDSGIFLYGAMLITKGHMPYIALFDNKPPLIYFIGILGYIIKSNPFLGIRIFEIVIFLLDLYLVRSISKLLGFQAVFNTLCFCALYLAFWDRGFLTETFNVPLVLVSTYVFIKRHKYTEYILVLCLILSFLLKPNAIGIIVLIAVIDVLLNYRKVKKRQKILRYSIALTVAITMAFLIFSAMGILRPLYFQAFQYNVQYVRGNDFLQVLQHYLFYGPVHLIVFLSFVLFNVSLLILLLQFYRKYSQSRLDTKNVFLCFAILAYYIEFIGSYSYGKTYPHYFLLLLVPASFLFGYFLDRYRLAKLAIVLFCFVVISWNIQRYILYRNSESSNIKLIKLVKNNTKVTDKIYVVGQDDTYLYTSTSRLSNTKYLMPLSESTKYTYQYITELKRDFTLYPPRYIIVNKNDWGDLAENYYYKLILNNAIANSRVVLDDNAHIVYALNGK